MGYFAVIDTETNWSDKVMSIGTIIADENTFRPIEAQYHVLAPEYEVGGMYDNTLFSDRRLCPKICSRAEALSDMQDLFSTYDVTALFAYNACFDRNHLPELNHYTWYDIMRMAAYRQYNRKIPASAPCCATGRLKRGYGVESMLKLLSGNRFYEETHNALQDAMDELEIMKLLGYCICQYFPL